MEHESEPGIHPLRSRVMNGSGASSKSVHISAASLDAYYGNALPETEARTVRNHLVGCTECRRTVLQMQSLVRLLRRLEGQPPIEVEDDGLAA